VWSILTFDIIHLVWRACDVQIPDIGSSHTVSKLYTHTNERNSHTDRDEATSYTGLSQNGRTLNVNNTRLIRYKIVKVKTMESIDQRVFSHTRCPPPNARSRSQVSVSVGLSLAPLHAAGNV
jgi:hypothetical protein